MRETSRIPIHIDIVGPATVDYWGLRKEGEVQTLTEPFRANSFIVTHAGKKHHPTGDRLRTQ